MSNYIERQPQVQYVIRSLSESDIELDGDAGAFWSNVDGWGSFQAATLFSTKERMSLNLPMSAKLDAEWMLEEEARDLEANRNLKKTDAERLNDYVVAFEVGRLVSRGAINDGTFDGQRLSASKHALSTPNEDVVSECLLWWDDAIKSGLLVERNLSNYIDPVDQKTGLDANVPPASKRQSSIKVPIVFGKNRTRGNSVGAMIDDMYGEHAVLRDLLSREARGVGIDPSTEYVTQGVSRVLRLYEEAHDAWLKSKGDTVGHVLEVELPSGQKLLMGSRQTLYGYEL